MFYFAGIVNLAISFFAINDDGTRRFLYAENGSLLKRKNGLTYEWKQSHAATLVNYFIQDREQLFSNIDLCLIEIQVSCYPSFFDSNIILPYHFKLTHDVLFPYQMQARVHKTWDILKNRIISHVDKLTNKLTFFTGPNEDYSSLFRVKYCFSRCYRSKCCPDNPQKVLWMQYGKLFIK